MSPPAFPPIAIIGRGCVLPGALTPRALERIVANGQTVIRPVPEGRWRVPRSRILAGNGWALTDHGGFVEGFAPVFDPAHFLIPAEAVATADRLVQWLLHAGRATLAEAGLAPGDPILARAGAIVGNLSFPNDALTLTAEAHWLGRASPVPPTARFNSGLPAHLLCAGLGLGAGGYALDAACASSLYAIHLACRRLHRGDADLMLAGAVNAVDMLMLHTGFTALGAISPTGRSRPFNAQADGLLPAEGAALVLLRRLEDAVATGDRILGVIRGIGLSNDGRTGGFLAPSPRGQEVAMRLAYETSGIAPEDVGLIECHATGTQLGDATEIASTASVYARSPGVVISSLKANLGHTITVAGAAGLLKVLSCMELGFLPATPNAEPTIGALTGTPFRILSTAEPWQQDRRCAAISGFGFGGNNAHMIVEAWDADAKPSATKHRSRSPVPVPIAIVAISARVGSGGGMDDFVRALYAGEPVGAAETVHLPIASLRFPPNDLRHAQGQQTMLLAAALDAMAAVHHLSPSRTAVIVGSQCDAEACWMPFRIRLPELAPGASSDSAEQVPMVASDVIGYMPNIPANRLNSQFDLGGPSFTVAAEELSGLRALEVACDMLAEHEIDAAIVGAADLSHEPIHRAALAALGRGADRPGDAAVVLVLKRFDDAMRDADHIWAVVEPSESSDQVLDWTPIAAATRKTFGNAHAAAALLDVAAAALALDRSLLPPALSRPMRPWLPDQESRRVVISETALGGQSLSVRLCERPRARDSETARRGWSPEKAGAVVVYGGVTLDALRSALVEDQPLPASALADPMTLAAARGPRLALVRGGETAHSDRRAMALDALDRMRRGEALPPLPPEIAFRDRPLAGEMAFVFTGSAAAYAGMGRELLAALPGLVDVVHAKMDALDRFAGWVYDDPPSTLPSDFAQLCGSSLLCQAHAALTLDLLTLKPAAAIGISSGETNALFAFGAWRDISGLLADITAASLYETELSGHYRAVKDYWHQQGIAEEPWESWEILMPVDAVQAAVARAPGAHIGIIYAPDDCLLVGPASACARAIASIGAARAIRLNIQLACHTPAAAPAAPLWRRLHTRPTTPQDHVRFYANAIGDSYPLTPDSIAAMLTAQAIDTVDFPRTIRKAYADGVRLFVEHGPRSNCAGWIRSILGDGDYLAVSLDAFGRPSLRQALGAVAAIAATGVPLRLNRLAVALAGATQPSVRSKGGPELILPAHRRPIAISSRAAVAEILPFPPVLDTPASGSVAASLPIARAAAGRRQTASVPEDSSIAVVSRIHAALTSAHGAYLDRTMRLQAAFLRLAAATPVGNDRRPVAAVPIAAAPSRPSTALSRADLEKLASGPLSAVWGERFAPLDHISPLVRMPQPPLLLADRILEIDAPPCVLGRGSITTETDVKAGDWFLHNGRVPAGITIEAGQADLLLVSWMGIDFHNLGQRVYRLLGCDLIYHGNLPRIGDTLRYRIEVLDHSALGDTRLFFFKSDGTKSGQPTLTVRNGQAGFFSPAELASAEGVLWDGTSPPTPDAQRHLDSAPCPTERRALDRVALDALAEGRAVDCFGSGFAATRTHTRTPAIPGGRMLLLHEVADLAIRGGPWGRGYLRAVWRFDPTDWFFTGHFLGDSCMPGTLMFEGGLQAMAILMTALGLTIGRDGWRFEPVPEETYRLRCRGQATPASSVLEYEIFVDEVIAGPTPTLFADILGTVDGLKAFHCRRMGLRLVPDWPLEAVLAENADTSKRPSAAIDGFALDYRSLLACALGKPSEAFGPGYAKFDDGRRLPRLPAPPYHFMTRIAAVDAPFLGMKNGGVATVEYDVPSNAWYFADPGGAMPFAVLFEVALQPCGWLGSFSGVPMISEQELLCRNLEGTARIHAHAGPGAERLTVMASLTSLANSGGVVLTAFTVSVACGDRPVLDLETKFGFFPAPALAQQVGLPVDDDDRAAYAAAPEGGFVVRGSAWGAWIAGEQLLMLDAVTGWWPTGGSAGLGLIRGEAKVDPGAWSFKAHFFQDPVQPGSLGIEAMLQLLKLDLLRRGLAEGGDAPEFDPILENEEIVWKYRGQVRPMNERVVTIVEIHNRHRDAAGIVTKGRASTWVDGIRIYEAKVGIRLRQKKPAERPHLSELVLDPGCDHWLADHRPTFVIPAMPWMATVELLMNAVADARGTSMLAAEEIRASGWLSFPAGPRRLRIHTSPSAPGSGGEATLDVWRETATTALNRFETVATARFAADGFDPEPVTVGPIEDGDIVHDADAGPDLYAQGRLFHGPSMRILRRLQRNGQCAAGLLQLPPDAPADPIARRCILLDGITHCIPGDRLHLWIPDLPPDMVGYPIRARTLRWHRIDVRPDHMVRAEVRFAGLTTEGQPSFAIRMTLLSNGIETVWVEGFIDYGLFPKGPIGILPPAERRAFLAQGRPCPGGHLVEHDAQTGVSTLGLATLADSNWLPGTIAAVYGCAGASSLILAETVAAKDHVALQLGVHPSSIEWDSASLTASYRAGDSVVRTKLRVTRMPDQIIVSGKSDTADSCDMDGRGQF